MKNVAEISKKGKKGVKSIINEINYSANENVLVENLLKIHFSNNMEMADTIQNIMKFIEKEKLVVEMHGSKFLPRTITKSGVKTQVYRTKHKGKVIQANEYITFIEKVSKAYGILDSAPKNNTLTVDEVFKLALDEKVRTDNIKDNTRIKICHEYARYISQDFQLRPVNTITEIYLKEYTQSLTTKIFLKKKAFLSYKGILNLIFNYAVVHKINSENPVMCIKNSIYLKNCDTSKPKNVSKILSEVEIRKIIEEADKRISANKNKKYYGNAFIVKLAIETGMRAAELCALKTSDIVDGFIHIHAQQLHKKQSGGKYYYYADYTKDEKGISNGGRYFPITPKIKAILKANEECKQSFHLDSEYVFCNEDKDWIKSDAYETFLRRMMKSLKMSVTNNHAFRMSLNSNVLIPEGINVADRAALLGHSIDTNLKNYSFTRKDNLNEIKDILSHSNHVVTTGHPDDNIFSSNEKSQELNEFKA